MGTTTLANQTAQDLRWFLGQARPRQLRTMRQFAEEEIVIPDGPYQGRRFRCSRQPYTRLWFDAVDSGQWNRFVATGPTQSGKTLSCFVTPLLYHLFEIGETVILGLPDMEMASDKWQLDILPVIERSRFRDLLPRKGGGSRGGRVETIHFGHGATLKFMSGGGSDKSRAGFTSRVVVITETDGMDQHGNASREADKITQLEARTRAYGDRKRIYMECTVSTEQGRTWREYQAGTRSRILLHCPHCQAWVSPEREHLTGWQGAETQTAARRTSSFACPDCGEFWNDDDRTQANADCQLIHLGQEINEQGSITGEATETDTLGFRWSAVNNLFTTAGEVGADEWRASRSVDEENAEREMRQFVWCLPTVPLKSQTTLLDVAEIVHRMRKLPRGVVPMLAKHLTAAVDIGKFLAHWVLVAWEPEAVGHVVDYGRIEVPSDHLGVEQAVVVALKQFHEHVQTGWPVDQSGGQIRHPDQVWIDAGYTTESVYAFCRQAGERYRPTVGRGTSQMRRQWYNRPTQTGSIVKHIGEGFHVNLLANENLYLFEVNADHWKSWVHQRLNTPMDKAGAMSLYQAPPQEHISFARHLTAEFQTEEFVAGKGVQVKWEQLRKQNHWFDALYNACAAASFAGVRLVEEPKPAPQKPRQTVYHMRRPDGSPWIDPARSQRIRDRLGW